VPLAWHWQGSLAAEIAVMPQQLEGFASVAEGTKATVESVEQIAQRVTNLSGLDGCLIAQLRFRAVRELDDGRHRSALDLYLQRDGRGRRVVGHVRDQWKLAIEEAARAVERSEVRSDSSCR
jgi:hypothetical protein